MPARFELENLESRAQQTELTDSDMEDFQRASDEETVAVPPAAATEHRQDPSTPQLASQELPADRGMIYSIVNELLGKITFNNPQAEELLVAALKDESGLPHSRHLLLEEVFSHFLLLFKWFEGPLCLA